MINYSIIIPHYNIPDLLARCLRSIPERDDVQVIVVDDNSPGHESYLSQISELSRKNVEFYVTTEGLGAGHARNVGLSHAKGKWLMFSDSDDFFVEDLGNILDKYVNDEHDLIFFNIKSCDCYDTTKIFLDGNKNHIFNKYYETGYDIYFRVCYTEPWGRIVRRSVIVDNGIAFQETKAHNDLLFAVKVGLCAERVLVVDKPLYWYVIREGSLGHQKKAEPFEKVCDRMIAWNSTQEYLEQKGIKTNFFLPAWPCIKATKRNYKRYFDLLGFAKRNKISPIRIVGGTLTYFTRKYFTGRKSLQFTNMLTKKSIKAYSKKEANC